MANIYEYNDNFLYNRIEFGYQETVEEHMAIPKISRLIIFEFPDIKVGDIVKPHDRDELYRFNGKNQPLTKI